VTCSADFYYLADPTDVGSSFAGQTWESFIEVSDTSNGLGIGTASSKEVITLRALSVSSAISYGSLAVSSTTGAFNPTTTIRNLGNDPIDISLQGTNLTDGLTSTIPTSQQKFSTSTFTYSSCTTCRAMSTTTISNYKVDLAKPTSIAVPVTDIVYWGIAIPNGVASRAHSGTNIFYAVTDIP